MHGVHESGHMRFRSTPLHAQSLSVLCSRGRRHAGACRHGSMQRSKHADGWLGHMSKKHVKAGGGMRPCMRTSSVGPALRYSSAWCGVVHHSPRFIGSLARRHVGHHRGRLQDTPCCRLWGSRIRSFTTPHASTSAAAVAAHATCHAICHRTAASSSASAPRPALLSCPLLHSTLLAR